MPRPSEQAGERPHNSETKGQQHPMPRPSEHVGERPHNSATKGQHCPMPHSTQQAGGLRHYAQCRSAASELPQATSRHPRQPHQGRHSPQQPRPRSELPSQAQTPHTSSTTPATAGKPKEPAPANSAATRCATRLPPVTEPRPGGRNPTPLPLLRGLHHTTEPQGNPLPRQTTPHTATTTQRPHADTRQPARYALRSAAHRHTAPAPPPCRAPTCTHPHHTALRSEDPGHARKGLTRALPQAASPSSPSSPSYTSTCTDHLLA